MLHPAIGATFATRIVRTASMIWFVRVFGVLSYSLLVSLMIASPELRGILLFPIIIGTVAVIIMVLNLLDL